MKNSLATAKQATQALQVSALTLRKFRLEGMPFTQVSRSFRYDLDQVVSWIQGRKFSFKEQGSVSEDLPPVKDPNVEIFEGQNEATTGQIEQKYDLPIYLWPEKVFLEAAVIQFGPVPRNGLEDTNSDYQDYRRTWLHKRWFARGGFDLAANRIGSAVAEWTASRFVGGRDNHLKALMPVVRMNLFQKVSYSYSDISLSTAAFDVVCGVVAMARAVEHSDGFLKDLTNGVAVDAELVDLVMRNRHLFEEASAQAFPLPPLLHELRTSGLDLKKLIRETGPVPVPGYSNTPRWSPRSESFLDWEPDDLLMNRIRPAESERPGTS